MNHKLMTIFSVLGIVFLYTAISAYAVPITGFQIIYQPDPGLETVDLQAAIDFDVTGANTIEITLQNLTSSAGFDIDSFEEYPAVIMCTGVAFQMPTGYSVHSGSVSGDYVQGNGLNNPNYYWGYAENAGTNGPFNEYGTIAVNTSVSTLSAAVQTTFANPPENVDGPGEGVYPTTSLGGTPPASWAYFNDQVTIELTLNGSGLSEAELFESISNGNWMAAFGSPIAVAEPATIFLLGSGIMGFAGIRRLFRK